MAKINKNAGSNTFSKGMNKDMSPIAIPNSQYRHAENAVNSSEGGDLFALTNEKGASHKGEALSLVDPGQRYLIIGRAELNDEIIVCLVSADNTKSEIGVFDKDGNYTTILHDPALNFDVEYQIDMETRIYFNSHRVIYFTDNKNTPRAIDLDDDRLDNYVYKDTSGNILDTDTVTSLFPKGKSPSVTYIEEENGGNLEVGVYHFAARFLDETLNPTNFGEVSSGVPVTDEPQASDRNLINGEVKGTNCSKSIRVRVNNIDTNYSYVELAVLSFVGPSNTRTAWLYKRLKITGPTAEFLVNDKDTFLETIDPQLVVTPTAYFGTVKTLAQKDGFLFLGNLTSIPQGDFQQIANVLTTGYKIKEIEVVNPDPPGLNNDIDALPTGTAINMEFNANKTDTAGYIDPEVCFKYKGYVRTEIYSLGIRFILKKEFGGIKTAVFHIPGQHLVNTGGMSDTPGVWTGETTGTLGTFISGNKYPDDAATWGALANQPVRHHRMPDLETEPHYRAIDEERSVTRILSITIRGLQTALDANPVLKNMIEGVSITRQRRDRDQNRKVFMQGVGQKMAPLWDGEHQGGTTGDPNFNAPYHTTVSPFFGKTSVETATRVKSKHVPFDTLETYPHPDTNIDLWDFPIHHGAMTDNACQFYSPEFEFLNRKVPKGVSIMPMMVMIGKLHITANQYAYITGKGENDQNYGWGLSLYANYTTFNPEFNATLYASKFEAPKIADGEFYEGQFDMDTPGLGDTFKGYEFPNIRAYNNEGITVLYTNPNSFFQEYEGDGRMIGDGLNPSTNFKYDVTIRHSQPDGIKEEVADANGEKVGFTGEQTWEFAQHNGHDASLRYLYNLQLDNGNQYGDVTGAEHIPIHTIDDATTVTDEFQVFGGDIFVTRVGFKNCTGMQLVYRPGANWEKDNVLEIGSARLRGGLQLQGDEYRAVSYFYVESEVNCDYRHREGENDAGVPFFPNTPKINDIDQTITLPSKNTYLLSSAAAGVLDADSGLGRSRGYNDTYSTDNLFATAATLPFGFQEITRYANRVAYSERSFDGEVIDKYKSFLINDTHDIPKNSGEIWNLFHYNDKLWIHTLDSLYRTYVNEKAALQSLDSDAIYLGSGGLFNITSSEVFTIEGGHAGTQSQFGGVQTPFGYAFPDVKRGKILLLTDQVREISQDGLFNWIAENIGLDNSASANPNYIDNPANPAAQGMIGVYDQRFKRAIFTKHDAREGESFTLSYSFLNNTWISYHDYKPNVYISTGRGVFYFHNEDAFLTGGGVAVRLFEHNKGEYGELYDGTKAKFKIQVIANSQPFEGKTFDNLVVISDTFDEATGIYKHKDFFDRLRITNDHQNSDFVPTVLSTPEQRSDMVKLRNNQYQIAIPFDQVLDKFNNIYDLSNLATQLAPGDSRKLYRPRMKDKYISAEFEFDNIEDYRISVRNILSVFRKNYL